MMAKKIAVKRYRTPSRGVHWLLYSSITSIAVYTTSLIVYRLFKVRLRVDQGIVPANHNTRVESSANGMTNAATIIAMILVIVIFIATFVGVRVKEAFRF